MDESWMYMQPFEVLDGKVCENGEPISQERIVKLLNESSMVRDELMHYTNLYRNANGSGHYFRFRCGKLEIGIEDCVKHNKDLEKFAKEMGII